MSSVRDGEAGVNLSRAWQEGRWDEVTGHHLPQVKDMWPTTGPIALTPETPYMLVVRRKTHSDCIRRLCGATTTRQASQEDTYVEFISAPLLNNSSAASLLLLLTAMCRAVRPDGPAVTTQQRGAVWQHHYQFCTDRKSHQTQHARAGWTS